VKGGEKPDGKKKGEESGGGMMYGAGFPPGI